MSVTLSFEARKQQQKIEKKNNVFLLKINNTQKIERSVRSMQKQYMKSSFNHMTLVKPVISCNHGENYTTCICDVMHGHSHIR